MNYKINGRALIKLFFLGTIFIVGLTANLKAQPVLDTLGNFWNLSSGTSIADIRVVSIDSSGFIYTGIWDLGIKRSTDAGSTWFDITNNLTHKSITAIEFDSTGKIYVATYGGGIFVSANNGNNWSQINNGIADLRITSLKIQRGGPMFVGTKNQGIYRSIDGGQNWTQVNTGLNIWEITALHIARNGFILAATSSWGIYRSENSGLSWKRSNGSLTNKNVTSFAQNTIGEILCGTLGGGVNFSVDNGASWTEFYKSDKCVNATSVVWATNTSPVAGLIDKGIVKYDDRITDDWIFTSFRFSGVSSIAKSANGTLWAAFPMYGLYKSTNQGANWVLSTGAAVMGATAKTFAFKNGIVLSTTDAGGLQRSTDNGINWSSGGMNGLGISAAATDSLGNLLIATYTKSGNSTGTLYKSSDGGATWSSMFSKRDTLITAIAVNPQGILYTALKFPPKDPKNPDAVISELYMTTNNGINWSHITATSEMDGFKFIGINFNGDLYIYQKWGLYRSTNNGTDWLIVLTSETATVSSIGFSSTRAVYAGTNLGIFKSADHGVNWTSYDFGLTTPNVSYVIVTPYNQIFAALAASNGVVVSADAGRSWSLINRGTTQAPVQSFNQSLDGYLFLTTAAIYRSIEPNSLPAPGLQTPANNAEGVDLLGTFTWNQAPKADLYEFQVSSDPEFYSIKDYITTGSTSYTLKYKLESSSLHYWRVRSRSNNALGPWSPTRVFVSILDQPVLIDPPNKSASITNLGPILRWNKLKGASVYSVQVSTDPSFNTTVFSKDIANDTLIRTSNLQLYTKYYWRVAGKSSKAQGPWSDVWMFTTKLRPVTLKSPANGSTGMPNQVLMIWNLSTGANKYDLQIAKDSMFNQMVFEGLSDQNDRHTSKILENFTKYWWRVKAMDDEGSSDWSAAWSFTTVIAAPELISPNDASKDEKTSNTFRWKDYNAASNYHLQVALDNSFTELVVNDSTLLTNKLDVTTLNYYTTYKWRVRLYSSSTPGLWSTVWSFTTGIAQVKLVSPDNDAIELPVDMTFIWDDVKGADSYLFELSKVSDFASTIKTAEVTETKIEVKSLDPLTKYYFRVKAKYVDGEGEWSETRNFTTVKGSGVSESIPGMNNLLLYPNPFAENLSISFSLENDANVTIEVIDMKGVSVYRSDFGMMNSGNQMLNIAPAGLTQGSYTLNLMINGKSITRMINLVK